MAIFGSEDGEMRSLLHAGCTRIIIVPLTYIYDDKIKTSFICLIVLVKNTQL